MGAQTSYNFATPIGVAGGLYDLSDYKIDTRINADATRKLQFGMGVVRGDKPGVNVVLPTAESTAAAFDGLALNGFHTQQNMEGELKLLPKQSVGVLRSGRAWARIKTGISPAYGDALYLIKSGEDAGCFTNAADASAVEIHGAFIGGKGSGNVAPVELYLQK